MSGSKMYCLRAHVYYAGVAVMCALSSPHSLQIGGKIHSVDSFQAGHMRT